MKYEIWVWNPNTSPCEAYCQCTYLNLQAAQDFADRFQASFREAGEPDLVSLLPVDEVLE